MTTPNELQGVVTKVEPEPEEIPSAAVAWFSADDNDWHIMFVNDGNAREVSQRLANRHREVRLVRLVAQPEKREISEELRFILHCATTSAEYDVWDQGYPQKIRDAVAAVRKEFA